MDNLKNINNYADELLKKISTSIDYKMKNATRIESAIVSKVNSDNTVDVYIPPDSTKTFTHISNQSVYQKLKVGDGVKLLLPEGKYTGSWIIAKHESLGSVALSGGNTTVIHTGGSGGGGNPVEQVQSDWDIADIENVSYIKNKPIIPSSTSQLNNDSGFLTSLPIATDSVLGAIKVGSNLTISNGKLSASYNSASESISGLMSFDDKKKLNGIAEGAQVNTVNGVKGDSESSYRTGNINITKANVGLSNVDNTSDVNKPISSATQSVLNLKANTSDVPKNTSQLNNDSGFLTSLPSATLFRGNENPESVTSPVLDATTLNGYTSSFFTRVVISSSQPTNMRVNDIWYEIV